MQRNHFSFNPLLKINVLKIYLRVIRLRINNRWRTRGLPVAHLFDHVVDGQKFSILGLKGKPQVFLYASVVLQQYWTRVSPIHVQMQ